MSSLHDQLFSATGRGHILRQHGESVTHRPLGNSSNDVAMTAIFIEADPAADETAGKGTRRRATLAFPPSVAGVTSRSQFVVESTVWDAETDPTRAEGGMVEVAIVRREEEFRRADRAI